MTTDAHHVATAPDRAARQEPISAIATAELDARDVERARETRADPHLFFNREVSWLAFNQRVLELAEDDSVPLLERVRFCAIYSSNLDEFFMIRVAGLHDRVDAGVDEPLSDGRTP